MILSIDVEAQGSARLFEAAAAALSDQSAAASPVRNLLAQLDYLDGPPETVRHRAALLRAASRFRRIFALNAPDAPNLVALGAEVDPACFGPAGGAVGNVAGAGLSFRQAFEACVGEGVEYASQFPSDDDAIVWMNEDDALAAGAAALRTLWRSLAPYRRGGRPLTAWTQAASLADGEPVHVPADLCFRRPDDQRDLDPPWPLSTGTGAGPDPLDAVLHGLLELVERDAVALWWRGGRPARIVSDAAGCALLDHLRGGPTRRRSWLLDITSDVGVPVIVAASCNDDGFGLCCGFAARPTLADAADAAVTEMAQMELAHQLSETKRSVRGDAALNQADWHHIDRFTRLDVRATEALRPIVPPMRTNELPVRDSRAALGFVRQRIQVLGLSPCAVNLTRSAIGVPVVRALCPGLEVGLTSPPGPRLRAAAAAAGVDPMTAMPL